MSYFPNRYNTNRIDGVRCNPILKADPKACTFQKLSKTPYRCNTTPEQTRSNERRLFIFPRESTELAFEECDAHREPQPISIFEETRLTGVPQNFQELIKRELR